MTDELKRKAAVELLGQGWSHADIKEATGIELDKCLFCGADATLLCDGTLPRWYLLSMRAARSQKIANVLNKHLDGRVLSDVLTTGCDAPMCKECAFTPDGPIFFCGEDGGVETRDYCPECAHYKYNRRQFKKWDLKPVK